MAGEVVVDALPYFDQGYDEPGVREAVIEWNVNRISSDFFKIFYPRPCTMMDSRTTRPVDNSACGQLGP